MLLFTTVRSDEVGSEGRAEAKVHSSSVAAVGWAVLAVPGREDEGGAGVSKPPKSPRRDEDVDAAVACEDCFNKAGEP